MLRVQRPLLTSLFGRNGVQVDNLYAVVAMELLWAEVASFLLPPHFPIHMMVGTDLQGPLLKSWASE